MSPFELLGHAIDAAKRWKAYGLTGEPVVQLTMIRERRPTGRTVRLFGDRGPKGDVSLVRPAGDAWKVVAVFPAVAVATWITKAAERAGTPLDEPSRSAEREGDVGEGT
jgi:hypothetical protein